MKELLRFKEMEGLGKTKTFNVYSTHSDDFLGVIHWRVGWRCYVMSYQPEIDMSLSCSKELNEFIQKLEDARKERFLDNTMSQGKCVIAEKSFALDGGGVK